MVVAKAVRPCDACWEERKGKERKESNGVAFFLVCWVEQKSCRCTFQHICCSSWKGCFRWMVKSARGIS